MYTCTRVHTHQFLWKQRSSMLIIANYSNSFLITEKRSYTNTHFHRYLLPHFPTNHYPTEELGHDDYLFIERGVLSVKCILMVVFLLPLFSINIHCNIWLFGTMHLHVCRNHMKHQCSSWNGPFKSVWKFLALAVQLCLRTRTVASCQTESLS